MNLFRITIICVLTLLSCNDIGKDNFDGLWITYDHDESNIDEVYIEGDSIIIIDKYRCQRFGLIDRNIFMNSGKIKLLGTDKEISKFGDNKIMIDSIVFNYLDSPVSLKEVRQDFEIIGLDSRVYFTDIEQGNKQNYLPIKIRNKVFEKRLILGEKVSNLNEIILFAPDMICANTRPKKVIYDGAIVFIEKDAELSDLINVQQQLLIRNRITKFILVTKFEELNKYQVVVNHLLNLPSDLTEMNRVVESYLGTSYLQWPPFLNYGNSLDYLNSDRVLYVKINNLKDFKEKEILLMDFTKSIVVQINPNLNIADYIKILIEMQSIGVNFKTETLTRVIN